MKMVETERTLSLPFKNFAREDRHGRKRIKQLTFSDIFKRKVWASNPKDGNSTRKKNQNEIFIEQYTALIV